MVNSQRTILWRIVPRIGGVNNRLQRFIVVCATIYAISMLLYSFFQINMLQPERREYSIKNNVCPAEIDIVYTWVNGSDPAHLEERTATLNRLVSGTLRQYCIITNLNQTTNHLLPVMAIRPSIAQLKDDSCSTNRVQNIPQSLLYKHDIERIESYNSNFSLIYFRSLSGVHYFSQNCILQISNQIHHLTPLFLEDSDNFTQFFVENIFLYSNDNEKLNAELGNEFVRLETGLKNVTIFLPKSSDQNLSSIVEEYENSNIKTLKYPVPVKFHDSSYSQHANWNENIELNRFADNDELKYSLRSVEKFAPWIRNIYLVTSGQIPVWLNLKHPKIRLIKHEDIFPNRSHLPTFSSSAIESHLHLISGLSERFLYFNDDIILGEPIFLDDFYTESGGFKIRLAWPVPNCAAGCPLNWLNDGSCDKPCNTSRCLFDGGDCLNVEPDAHNDSASSMSFTPALFGSRSTNRFAAHHNNLCAAQCLSNWLGDGFCDQVCNKLECAFDMADCGVQNFTGFESIQLMFNQTEYVFTKQTNNSLPILYFNLTDIKYFQYENNSYELDVANLGFDCDIQPYSVVWNQNFNVLVFMMNLEKFNLISLNFTLNVGDSIVYYEARIFSKQELLEDSVDDPGFDPEPKDMIRDEIFKFQNKISNIKNNRSMIYAQPKPKNFENVNECRIDDKAEIFVNKIFSAKQANNSELIELYKSLLCQQNRRNEERNRPVMKWMDRIISDRLNRTFPDKYSRIIHKRKLLEAYADSLVHVNHLLNRRYGKQIRQVPAHIAHYLDRNILQRMYNEFHDEFEKTSSSKIRTGNDMQFAFTYFYYLMNENAPKLNTKNILKEFDTDHSGDLSLNEQRTVALRYYSFYTDFANDLSNCSLSVNETINVETLSNCRPLSEIISMANYNRKRNSFQILNESDVAFKMLRSNRTLLLAELDDLRKQPRKFICLNDNFNYQNKTEEMELRKILHDFYESLFPIPSRFEK